MRCLHFNFFMSCVIVSFSSLLMYSHFYRFFFPLYLQTFRAFFYAKFLIDYYVHPYFKKIQRESKIVVVLPISRCGSLTVNCPVHSHNYSVRLPSQHPPRKSKPPRLRQNNMISHTWFLDLFNTFFALVSSSCEVEHPLCLLSISASSPISG
jgi:hypothetical protein